MNPHAHTGGSLSTLFLSCYRHPDLISQITRREVAGRYRGSLVGLGWSFLNPVLMLAVFTFVFSVVFQTKWNVDMAGKNQGQGLFAVVLFMGLILHGMLAEVLTRSPAVIVSNVNFVKKVIFPLEILPISIVFSAIFHAFVSIMVWLVAHLLLVGLPAWHIVFLPLVMLPLAVLALGVSFFLASLGVFMRDINQTMGILVTVLLFLSPIFFPVDRLPEPYQPLFILNPLTFIIEQARAVALWGQYPDFIGLAIYMAGALILLWGGFAWFQKTRVGFPDVL